MHGKISATVLSAALVTLFHTPVYAEWAPSEPLKIIIPFGAGGSTDVFGRVVAGAMAEQTGWTVIVENRPGAGGEIGQLEVANAKPDGHTIGLSSTSLFSIQPYMPDASGELTSDSVDFLGTLSVIPYAIIAGSEAPFDNLAELAEYSQGPNGPAKFSSTSQQLALALEEMNKDFGINYVAAQTSGSGESLQLVAGRHADFTISGGVHVSYILDGRMKVLAHMVDEPADYAPDRPTVADQGGTLPLRNYFLFNAPKGLPEEATNAIAVAIDNALQADSVKTHAEMIHVKLDNLGPEGAAQDVAAQAERWRAILGR